MSPYEIVAIGVLGLLGVIWKLLADKRSLEDRVKQSGAEKELGATIHKIEEAKRNADAAEKSYRDTVSAYKREHGEGDGVPGRDP